MNKSPINQLATRILDAAFEVHRNLGAGLLESAYEIALCHELSLAGIPFEHQKSLPLRYKGIALDCSYRIDLLIADQIILELKCVEALSPLHSAQLITYLKLSGKHLGYLINFQTPLLKNGIKRIVNGLPDNEPINL